jgi:hypothetical protein
MSIADDYDITDEEAITEAAIEKMQARGHLSKLVSLFLVDAAR